MHVTYAISSKTKAYTIRLIPEEAFCFELEFFFITKYHIIIAQVCVVLVAKSLLKYNIYRDNRMTKYRNKVCRMVLYVFSVA